MLCCAEEDGSDVRKRGGRMEGGREGGSKGGRRKGGGGRGEEEGWDKGKLIFNNKILI